MKKVYIALIAAVFLLLIFILSFHSGKSEQLFLATTTSTYDSGLLEYLMPVFERKYNIKVNILSRGTGESLEILKRGDADIVLVHSRPLEEIFVAEGYGVHRIGVMYNDFIIVGPKSDPAGISGCKNATLAFARIAAQERSFVSRADHSGTHMLELRIWNETEVRVRSPPWYIEAGAGMGTVLRMANEKRAYTLTDRGTWLSFSSQLQNLGVLVEKEEILLNPYSIILVNPDKYPNRNFKMASLLGKFLVSDEGQKLIGSFKKENETLFTPMAREIDVANRLGYLNQREELGWYSLI